MCSLALNCMQMKPMSGTHRLIRIILECMGIILRFSEIVQVISVECSRAFGHWIAHIELLTAGRDQAESLLHEQCYIF
ncbi:hypothetical protein M0R45_007661 [Rubus argutus]|uniref:Uncharacterized protein n=1 Tax=Rubus argutus TaxID=59490 RepID=A0AAW1XYC6_RUBAR